MRCQRGYALAEVLVAAAIAAGVFAAASTAISTSIRLSSRTSDMAMMLQEAEAIAARLKGGMSKPESLEGYEDWTIEYEPVELGANRPGAMNLQRAVVQYQKDGRNYAFDVLVQDGSR